MATASDLRDAGFDERQAAAIERAVARSPAAKEGTPRWVALLLVAILSAILAWMTVELRDARAAIQENRERLAVLEERVRRVEANQEQLIATQQQLIATQQQLIANQQQVLQLLRSR